MLSTIMSATVVTEIGDAGQTLGTAQALTGLSGAIDHVDGTLSNTGDVDMYALTLSSGAFAFTTLAPPGTLGDPQLFLFNAAGGLVLFNDDFGPGFQSQISSSGLTAGLYYLAISGFNNDPIGSPLSGWSTGNYSGTYRIELRGVTSANAVPEPSSILLVGVGVAVLGAVRRVRR